MPMHRRDMKCDRFHEIVGDQIRMARERVGITQPALAEKLGVTLQTVQRAEEGVTCSLYMFARIATELDTTLDDLVPLDAVA